MTTAGKLPYMQFYTGDWMKDPALRSVSLPARGLWIDVLCLMWEAHRRGYLCHRTGLPFTSLQLARMVGSTEEEVDQLVQELVDCGVCSRSDDGVLYSRRMERDEQRRRTNQENGRKGGNPTLKDESVNRHPKRPDIRRVNRPSNPHIQSSETESKSETETESEPRRNTSAEPQKTAIQAPEHHVFRCRGDIPEWTIPESLLTGWREIYPHLDIETEIRKSQLWLSTNEGSRKTAKGMAKFLNGWMDRAQNRNRGQPALPFGGAAAPNRDELRRAEREATNQRLDELTRELQAQEARHGRG